MTASGLLKSWREQQKITQAAASRLMPVSQATWCDWESGTKVPRVDLAVRLEALTEGAVKVTDWADALTERKAAEGPKGDAA